MGYYPTEIEKQMSLNHLKLDKSITMLPSNNEKCTVIMSKDDYKKKLTMYFRKENINGYENILLQE